jgi:hypothetical protein
MKLNSEWWWWGWLRTSGRHVEFPMPTLILCNKKKGTNQNTNHVYNLTQPTPSQPSANYCDVTHHQHDDSNDWCLSKKSSASRSLSRLMSIRPHLIPPSTGSGFSHAEILLTWTQAVGEIDRRVWLHLNGVCLRAHQSYTPLVMPW